jgi:hypothetical protein
MNITYGTNSTSFSNGSSRLKTTLSKKASKIRKKYNKRKKYALSRSL